MLRGAHGALAFIAIGIITCCAACAPSDPELPPVGIRITSDGTIELALPTCADESIDRAEVTPFSASTTPPPAWTGRGFQGAPTGVVRLAPADWSAASGSYAGLSAYSVDIRTSVRLTGLSVDDVATIHASGDDFDVDGRALSLEAYRALVEPKLHCSDADRSPTE